MNVLFYFSRTRQFTWRRILFPHAQVRRPRLVCLLEASCPPWPCHVEGDTCRSQLELHEASAFLEWDLVFQNFLNHFFVYHIYATLLVGTPQITQRTQEVEDLNCKSWGKKIKISSWNDLFGLSSQWDFTAFAFYLWGSGEGRGRQRPTWAWVRGPGIGTEHHQVSSLVSTIHSSLQSLPSG
jgi:hypothetical protein